MDVSRSSSNTTWFPAVRAFVTVWPATSRSTPLIGGVSLPPQATKSANAKHRSVRRTVDVRKPFTAGTKRNLIIRNSRFFTIFSILGDKVDSPERQGRIFLRRKWGSWQKREIARSALTQSL